MFSVHTIQHSSHTFMAVEHLKSFQYDGGTEIFFYLLFKIWASLVAQMVKKESTCNAGDLGSIPGSGRSSGGGHGNLFQCSCLENPHGQRYLAGYSPWGRRELDTTEWQSTAQHLKFNLKKPLEAAMLDGTTLKAHLLWWHKEKPFMISFLTAFKIKWFWGFLHISARM